MLLDLDLGANTGGEMVLLFVSRGMLVARSLTQEPELRVIGVVPGKEQRQLVFRVLMALVCMMFTVMFGSGFQIVGIITMMMVHLTRKLEQVVDVAFAFCAGVLGSMILTTSARPTATGSIRATEALTSAFVSPRRFIKS